MKLRISLLILSLLSGTFLSAQDLKISSEDINKMIGHWEGSLRYIDYSSGQPYQMPCNLDVEKGKSNFELNFIQSYPNEPHANKKGKFKFASEGSEIDGHDIVSRTDLDGEEVEYVVEYEGKDDNKKALIRLTYIIGPDVFVQKKEVQFEPQGDWMVRNTFSYIKGK